MKMEVVYLSHQVVRQCQIKFVEVGKKRASMAQEDRELREAHAELLRNSDSHTKTKDFIELSVGKGMSQRQRMKQRRHQQKLGAGGSLSACSHPPLQLSGDAHPSQAGGIQPAHNRDNSFSFGDIIFPMMNFSSR